MSIGKIMQVAPVIPVLVLDGSIDPVALAETMVDAGLPVLEVTLRTPFALDAIRSMSSVDGAIVGAGTVLDQHMLEDAIGAGAKFVVSPGLTKKLGAAAVASGVPFLPGVSNAGDIMRGLELGLDRFKFFPAEASGGLNVLTALAAPFAMARFCPTGGIREETAQAWLANPSVDCVGGSWLVQPGDNGLDAVSARAKRASSLRSSMA